MSFSRDMRRFSAKAAEAHDKITRVATLELFRGVIMATPVDIGRARGAWTTSVGAPSSSPDRIDKSGGASIAEAEAKTPAGAGQITNLSNDMPYIIDLEDGSSTQAPEGMVRRNMDRVQRMVNAAIRNNKV